PCYLLLKPLREFLSEPHYLGFCLIGTSLILFAGTNRKSKEEKAEAPKTSLRDALLIGTVQSAALIPGISRSASTISCARLLGWTPSKAVRFSFLLSIPTIIGGNSLEALRLFTSGKPVDAICLSTCAAAFIASCITGLFIIRFAISFLEKGNLKPFAWYCLILGTITTVLLSFMG
ncbi:MAG: undecaprenyl-diphosphate phosphatase, partial [Chlamydiales bacterium]|nr:undecaprenyl-diphosphate phosphatase [Chlamydiales bacterium]